MIVKAGSTNVSVYYYIVQDASATSPGEPVTGLLFSDIETGGSASYMRQGAARVDLTLITLASASATHADGGFILVDDTNMPGLYRCDYPDAAFVTGVDQTFCQIVVASANNAVAAPILIDIDDNIDQTGDSFARIGVNGAGLTAIDLPDQTMDITGNITGNLSGSVGSVTGAVGSVTGNVGGSVASVTGSVGSVTGSVGSVTSAVTVDTINANVINAASIAAGAMDGKGDWNIGKTGYTLTQSFPSNFASMVISGAGSVDSLLQGFFNTLATEPSVGRIAGNFSTFYGNADAATTQTVDDVGGGGGGGTDWTASERNEIRGRLGVTGTTAAGGNTPTLSLQTTVEGIPTTAEFDARTLLASGYFDASTDVVIVGTMNAGVIDAASIASSAMDGKGDWNIGKTGYSLTITPPTAVQNRQEMDANSVDLNTLISGQTTINDNVLLIPTTSAPTVTEILTTQMTESYAANGVAPTLAEAQFAIHQMLMSYTISGTSVAVRQLNDVTAAFTATLDDGTSPTGVSRP